MPHRHHEHHSLTGVAVRRKQNRRRLLLALFINAGLLVATLVGGFLTDSLALLAESGHLVSDVGAIGIALLAAHLAGLAPTPSRTFGLQRSEIIAALVNGLALVSISVLIVVEALVRLSDAPEVGGTGVLVLGLVGLAGNVAATVVLATGEREDINLEAVLRHSLGDALSSIGVVVAGVVVLATGWNAADAVASIFIALLIAASSWRPLKEPFDVLMEAAPRGIDVGEVGRAMVADPEIVEVHDLHVWTVTSGFPALSAHVVVHPGSDRDAVRRRVEAELGERFAIDHTTLQVVETAAEEDLIELERPRPSD